MREGPILFSAPMVRAILDGSKTQTRRAVKLPHNNPLGVWEPTTFGGGGCKTSDGKSTIEQPAIWHTRTGDCLICPYGHVGDQLWVRETWNGPFFEGDLPIDWSDEKYLSTNYCVYRASGDSCEYVDMDDNIKQRWKPSIYMPRWASRIQLEIVGIRVERLQDIDEVDALAEGITENFGVVSANGNGGRHNEVMGYRFFVDGNDEVFESAVDAYKWLWESINGAGTWDKNPWVWVVEFKRIKP